MTSEELEPVQQDVVRRREVGYEQLRVVVAERIRGGRGMASLVLAREARHRAHDETHASVVEQSGASFNRLQRTACQSAPGCVLNDGQGKHTAIFNSAQPNRKRSRIPSASPAQSKNARRRAPRAIGTTKLASSACAFSDSWWPTGHTQQSNNGII